MSAMPQIAPITEMRNTHTGVLSKLKISNELPSLLYYRNNDTTKGFADV